MENQRVRMSKKLLKEALISLLAEKNIEKITIYELCERATINRTTFYKYYGSQYDLLDEIEADTFAFIEKELRDNPLNPVSQITTILHYARENIKTMRVLTESTTDKEFAVKLFSLPVIREGILRQTPQGLPAELSEYLLAFYSNGWYAIIRQWLQQGAPGDTTELAHFLFALSEMNSNLTAISLS